MEPALVTRQLGLSSAARHLGFAPVVRTVVDEANKLRYHAFGLITAYYSRVASDLGGSPVMPLSVDFVDTVFQLLTADVICPDPRLTESGTRYRTMLADASVDVVRCGSLARIGQSFRANILTSLSNYYNQPYALQRSYLRSKYELGNSDAKALAARLDCSRAEVEATARALAVKQSYRAEHIALEELIKEESPASILKYEKALQNRADVLSMSADEPTLWTAFNSKFPLPKYEGAQEHWEAEMQLLPETNAFSDLFANYARMVSACVGNEKCRQFAICPSAGFAADFVPMDKATLKAVLVEARVGLHGASTGLQRFVGANLTKEDDWGLYVLFKRNKLKKLFTTKHGIDGQILTDGVRVIFPLRTPEASKRKAAAGAASGRARSTDGKMDLVSQHLLEEDAVLFAAGSAIPAAKRKRPEFEGLENNLADLLIQAKTVKAKADADKKTASKAAAIAEKKRARDAMTADGLKDERNAKVATKKSKREDPYSHIQSLPADWYVTGVDVGHCFPVYAARKRVGAPEDERCNFFKVSLGQWYTTTGQRSRARLQQQKLKRAKLRQLPSRAVVGNAIWDVLEDRARSYASNYAVYGSIALRRAAFDCYMKKQKALMAVHRKLLPDQKTVLAWGDGNFAHTRRGLATAVHGTIEKYIKQRSGGSMRMTPEHRTSQNCSCCHSKMEHVVHGVVLRRNGMPFTRDRLPGGSVIRREIHGLYQCTKVGCYTRWDRDKNAAINIRNIFLSICKTRMPPLHFQRSFKME